MKLSDKQHAAALKMYNALESVKNFFDTWSMEIGPAEETLFEEINSAHEAWIRAHNEDVCPNAVKMRAGLLSNLHKDTLQTIADGSGVGWTADEREYARVLASAQH